MKAKLKPPAFTNRERGDVARKKLIEAGLKIYSEVGFRGASTRKLAATAGVNIAAIPYYFGSKEGLYLAVIDYIVDYYQKNLGGGLLKIRQTLKNKKTTCTECCALLDECMRMLVCVVLRESKECSQISRIYTREQLDPTSAFKRLYDGFIKDMRETLEALVATILEMDAHSSEIKLIIETLIGQVAIFRSSRTTVLHNMGWKNYGEERMADIERIVTFNVNALIQAYRKKESSL
jgi:TetR/AcrR family transcriptional regulator, regulator of cefoperazone and chloramphenicol sensitivity